MKKSTSRKYSKISLYKKENIDSFRKNNSIKSEESITDSIKQFKLKSNKDVRVFDYYEYKIDDKDLSDHIDALIYHNEDSSLYNPNHSFSDSNVGCIGPFGYFWDRIRIMQLLRKEINEELFIQEDFAIQRLKITKEEYQEDLVKSIVEESKKSTVSLYFTYGDEFYPIQIFVEIKDDVRWVFDSGEGKLEWKFEKENYCNTLNSLLQYLEKCWLETMDNKL